MRKLPGGYVVESGASQIERLGTAPVLGFDYPRCRECGFLRDREVTARVIHGDQDLVSKLRQEMTRHIRAEHPWTLGVEGELL